MRKWYSHPPVESKGVSAQQSFELHPRGELYHPLVEEEQRKREVGLFNALAWVLIVITVFVE